VRCISAAQEEKRFAQGHRHQTWSTLPSRLYRQPSRRGGGEVAVHEVGNVVILAVALSEAKPPRLRLAGLKSQLAHDGADQLRPGRHAPAHQVRVNPLAGLTAAGGVGEQVTHPSLDPSRVATTVALLAHERCLSTGETFQASGTHVSRTFLGETAGLQIPGEVSPGLLLEHWVSVMDTTSYTIPAARLDGDTSLSFTGSSQPGSTDRERSPPSHERLMVTKPYPVKRCC
jgi:hypothetical protein